MEELKNIQSELKAPKNQFNNFGGYKYRNQEDILEAVKPLLGKYGCTLTLSDDMLMLGDRFYVKSTATLRNNAGDSVQTTAFAREELTKKGMDASQITGSASSYSRKYALNGLFCIDDTKDVDNMNNTGNGKGADEEMKDLMACALQELRAATSRESLNGIYANYKETLGKSQRFLDEMNARAAQLGITPKR